MKILGRKNYGSIPHLSNSKLGSGDHFITEGQERILTKKTRDKNDLILVFEKYDGTNVGICKKNNEIFALTRSGYLANTSPYPQHHVFFNWVNDRVGFFKERLKEGERITGEWLYQAHSIIYDINQEPIVFFDYFNNNNERLLYSDLLKIDVPTARLIHSGKASSVDTLLPILNKRTPKIKSRDLPEGMVYRVERKGKVDFLAKWVRKDFEAGKYIINVDSENYVFNNIEPNKRTDKD
jgi:hypothetical protein